MQGLIVFTTALGMGATLAGWSVWIGTGDRQLMGPN